MVSQRLSRLLPKELFPGNKATILLRVSYRKELALSVLAMFDVATSNVITAWPINSDGYLPKGKAAIITTFAKI